MKLLRRVLTPFLAFLLALAPIIDAAPAQAFTSGQNAGIRSGAGWSLQQSNVDLFFSRNAGSCAINRLAVNCASLLSISRASSETSLLPTSAAGAPFLTFGSNVLAIVPGLGLQVFQAATNLLLHSSAPSTQTTASLGTGTYTLWVNGSGSATMSAGTGTGCGTGAATNGTPVSFTISVSGTCTVTVTGSLNAFQLEAGSFGTPFIVTVSSTVTRAADVITLKGAALAAALNARAARFVTNGPIGQITNVANELLSLNSSQQIRYGPNISTQPQISNGTNTGTGNLGSGSITGLTKIATGFDATSMTIIGNGGSKTTQANAWGSTSSPVWLGSNQASTSWLNGYMLRATSSPVKSVFDQSTTGSNPQ